MPWEHITIFVSLPLMCLVGIMLTAIALPGNWLILLAAAGTAAWQPGMISWWTIAALLVLALIGEGLEFLASALGAKQAGATKQGAIGAFLGTILGAIVGLPFVPPLGAIVGGAFGAAAGAIIAERAVQKRTWEESAKAGAGAAIGRIVATITKLLIAVVMAMVACVAMVL